MFLQSKIQILFYEHPLIPIRLLLDTSKTSPVITALSISCHAHHCCGSLVLHIDVTIDCFPPLTAYKAFVEL